MIKDKEIEFKWRMYNAWKNGISPIEFRKCYNKDINDCIDIDNAITEKKNRQNDINNLMNKIRM